MTQREREKRRVSCACVCLVQRKIPASALINNLFFAGEHVQSASVRRAKQTSIRRNLHESLALSNSAGSRDEERRRVARIRGRVPHRCGRALLYVVRTDIDLIQQRSGYDDWPR